MLCRNKENPVTLEEYNEEHEPYLVHFFIDGDTYAYCLDSRSLAKMVKGTDPVYICDEDDDPIIEESKRVFKLPNGVFTYYKPLDLWRESYGANKNYIRLVNRKRLRTMGSITGLGQMPQDSDIYNLVYLRRDEIEEYRRINSQTSDKTGKKHDDDDDGDDIELPTEQTSVRRRLDPTTTRKNKTPTNKKKKKKTTTKKKTTKQKKNTRKKTAFTTTGRASSSRKSDSTRRSRKVASSIRAVDVPKRRSNRLAGRPAPQVPIVTRRTTQSSRRRTSSRQQQQQQQPVEPVARRTRAKTLERQFRESIYRKSDFDNNDYDLVNHGRVVPRNLRGDKYAVIYPDHSRRYIKFGSSGVFYFTDTNEIVMH